MDIIVYIIHLKNNFIKKNNNVAWPGIADSYVILWRVDFKRTCPLC